jgi:two-component system sensor kinase FixL
VGNAEFFWKLFDTSGFAPRGASGAWSATHSWTHIVADGAICTAYLAIPCVFAYHLCRRRDISFRPFLWLIATLFFVCGMDHLVEATIFWHPWHRFSALTKVMTAIVSWAAVIAIIPMLPTAFSLTALASANRQLQLEITERKLAEGRFQLAVEAAPNAVVMISSQGLVVLVNSQTEKMFGYGRNELLGQSVELLVPDRFREQHPGYRRQFFGSPTVRSMGMGRELFGRRKDGSEFPVEIGLNPIETKEGLLVLSAIVDITERKQAEMESRRRLAELAHVGRLSTVGRMVSELAHEINQPLAAAANYSRACVRFARSGEGATTEQLLDWMEKTAVQATRALDIVKRLGSFVQLDSRERKSLDINQLVEDVAALGVDGLLTKNVMERVDLRRELNRKLPCILIDRLQIEQVLVNLIRNGIEANQGLDAADRYLVIQTSQVGECVVVSVSDRGPGITPKQITQLFDPFFTTKSDGVGLGLSISRTIIAAHEGRLWCEPNTPCGMTFRFELPIVAEQRA